MGNNESIVVCSQCGRSVYCDRETDVIICCPSCGALLSKLGSGNQ
jgi:predicted RNA-binding Zn-ribbon protein involved in translation (DUF1610 family)